MNPQLSKAIFGVGIALSLASIASIYATMIATQNQNQNQGSAQQQPASSGASPAASSSSSSSSSTQTGTGVSITIPNGAAAQESSLNKEYYKPLTVNISSGSRVTWTNEDIAAHTSTSGQSNNSPDSGQLFNTGTISPGSSGSAIVTGSGKIPYHCIFHPWMIASLQIGSTNSTASNSNNSSTTTLTT